MPPALSDFLLSHGDWPGSWGSHKVLLSRGVCWAGARALTMHLVAISTNTFKNSRFYVGRQALLRKVVLMNVTKIFPVNPQREGAELPSDPVDHFMLRFF